VASLKSYAEPSIYCKEVEKKILAAKNKKQKSLIFVLTVDGPVYR
jgi:hypothetical protein